MTWTTDRPTATGWYWYQATYSHPEVVYLWEFTDGTLLLERVGRPPSAMPDHGRWAGPITPPEES